MGSGGLKQKLLAVGLGTALALGIGEVGSRVYTSSGNFLLSHNPVIQKQSEGTDFFEPDGDYGHVLKDHSFVGSKKLECLDDVVNRVSGSGILVLNLGDSSTSGWNSDVVTENLQRKKDNLGLKSPFFTYPTYSDLLDALPNVASINAGVPGYSSDTGKRRIGSLLKELKQKGIKPDYVTVYFGNNDSVWNLNVEDRDLFIGNWDSHFASLVKGRLDVLSSRSSTRTRVAKSDYGSNLREIIATVRSYGAAPILIEPVIPKYWRPGLRATGQEQELGKWINGDYEASRQLRKATESYKNALKAMGKGDYGLAGEKFLETQSNDFIIPRIKPDYVRTIKRVAAETNTSIVSVQGRIPLDDRGYFIDYCHPIELANRLIAEDVIKVIQEKR